MSDNPTDPALVSGPPPSSPPTDSVDDIAQFASQTPPLPKERHSLTLEQRRNLRRWASNQPCRPSHKACIDWFYHQYGQLISQSTVSHSLSPKYSRLDGDNPQLSGSRLRFGNWPDVEKLVLLWYQQLQTSGRQPTNEELGEKAKAIFAALPRYKEEASPEFSPGWIHRFKKRYGLLIRRQRRHGEPGMNPADDINYLADCVPRFMAIASDTSPAAVREGINRVVGVEATLGICALVRDEILRRNMVSRPLSPPPPPPPPPPPLVADPSMSPPPPPQPEQPMYSDDDAEIVLQNALRQLQEDEQVAEEQAAVVREERERAERINAGLHSTEDLDDGHGRIHHSEASYVSPPHHDLSTDLTLTPIPSETPNSTHERPLRCPFCLNQRMLRTIKEAVEHLSTHVVV
jgi:hypothetical protein